VQEVNGANLRFRDTVRAAKVEPHGRCVALAVMQVLKYRIDLLLGQLTTQKWGSSNNIDRVAEDFSASHGQVFFALR
jgi:hypothetical protein